MNAVSKRTYRLQNFGGSFYLCLPANIITKRMLEHGVEVKIIHFDISKDEAVILIRAGVDGEHNTGHRESGKDA